MLLESVILWLVRDDDADMGSGNFADELGEDFLGLRDLGVAQEHGMQNLTIPTSVFYGRKKRHQDHFGLG
jgi:transcriptional activator SPT7